MKQQFFKTMLIAAATISVDAQAQSLADIKKMYDYCKYETVRKFAAPQAATNAEANYYLGLAQMALGETAAANATFAKYPADVANQSGLARLLFADKKTNEAMTMLNAMVAKAKKKDWQSYKYAADAITYTQGGDFNKAYDWYNKALAINQSGDLYLALGDAYLNSPDGNRGGDAETNFLLAQDYKANPSQVAVRRGDLWYAAKMYDSANANYDRCIKLDPSNPVPFSKYANSFYYTNRFEQAKSNMESYLKLSDNTTTDQLMYLNILYLVKDYNGTLTKINELKGRGLSKPYFSRLAGFCNYELGNYPAALAEMDGYFKIAEKDKLIPSDYTYYAKILSKTPGREAEATNYKLKAIELDPKGDKSVVLREIADSFKAKKDYANAALWYARVVNEGNPASLSNTDFYYHGWCNYASKNYAEAIKVFTAFAAKYPTEPSGYYYLGASNAYNDGGAKAGNGLEAYKKYAELVGSDASKKDNLTKAYSYIIEYYYEKNDATNAVMYATKLQAIDPANDYASQIVNYYKNGGGKPSGATKIDKTDASKASNASSTSAGGTTNATTDKKTGTKPPAKKKVTKKK